MIVGPCYLRNFEVDNKLQDIKMSPEWYIANNIPMDSMETKIVTSISVRVSFDILVRNTQTLQELVEFFDRRQKLTMTLEEEK